MCSSEQRVEIEKRVEYTCVTNCTQDTYKGKVVNVRSAVMLAFVMGARFGVASPYQAGEYMARWLSDRKMTDEDIEDIAKRHEQAMRNCTIPITYTAEQWEQLTDDDAESGC